MQRSLEEINHQVASLVDSQKKKISLLEEENRRLKEEQKIQKEIIQDQDELIKTQARLTNVLQKKDTAPDGFFKKKFKGCNLNEKINEESKYLDGRGERSFNCVIT